MASSLLNLSCLRTLVMNSSMVMLLSLSVSISLQLLSTNSSTLNPFSVPVLLISPDMSFTSFTSSDLEITPLLSTSKMRKISNVFTQTSSQSLRESDQKLLGTTIFYALSVSSFFLDKSLFLIKRNIISRKLVIRRGKLIK